jgi:hypothetical protein
MAEQEIQMYKARFKDISELRDFVTLEHASKKTWRAIAKNFVGVKPGTLCRIAHDLAYEPRDPAIRQRLGLPTLPRMVLTPACKKCGEAHPPKRCTKRAAPIKYELWRAANIDKLNAIVAWAESRPA